MKTAVETVFVGKDRLYNRRFLQMCSHYLVEPVASRGRRVQAHRTSMREDRAELRLVRRACSRLHLDQIRPHGLTIRHGSAIVG